MGLVFCEYRSGTLVKFLCIDAPQWAASCRVFPKSKILFHLL